MKKVVILIVIAFSLFLSSCSLVDNQVIELKKANEELTLEVNNWKDKYFISENAKNEVLQKVVDISETARDANIYITTTLTIRKYGLWETKKGGQGSGFIYKRDNEYYYALTNFHVINKQNANEVDYKVRFSSGLEVNGTVIAQGNLSMDLAVIRFPISGQEIPLTKMNAQQAIKLNDFALVVGNPNGLQNVVSPTKIIAIGKYLNGIDIDVLVFSYSMDAHGNSGGAVINIDGELIGILTWQGQDDADKKFAIPVSLINQFLKDYNLF